MARTVDSVACSFPPELIEMIIHDIPILDLMSVAASMPSAWRAVIEGLKKIATRIRQYAWDEDNDRRTTTATKTPQMPCRNYSFSGAHPLMPSSLVPVRAGQSCAFKYAVPNVGTLYIRRVQPRKSPAPTISTTPSEAFFLSLAVAPSTIRILDSATKNIKYTPGPRFGHGFVDLRDCEGMLAFSKGISTGERDLLFKYVVTFYGGEDCDETGLLRDAKKVDKGVGTAKKDVGGMGSGVGTHGTAGESGGVRRSGRIVKKTEKGESLTTK
ncbi:hypothetical protein BDY17DRAFT_324537 [Neohortaea acidophila]|uniref:F-box domain-containing protein n=1 Tax=Neohortaea acidophila TaxID=245834 RepID=A0A6A6PRE4_9PEZI|nr:uncharacterized protein BDY17DRAFT_324537 [Neohortaea acidophila]KAF2482241.1 hypothetical protein BDY17DRAFT_324537 [Neohortaea acidophila]